MGVGGCFKATRRQSCSKISTRSRTYNKNHPLRKLRYINILKISPPKNWKFSDKNSDIIHISAQNIDCGYSLEPPRRGGSNVYPQSMFLSTNKKNNVYPCKPQFYYIKVAFWGSKLYRYVFVMAFRNFYANVGKKPLIYMRTATVQMCVHVRAAWSGHSLSVGIHYWSVSWYYKRSMNALISQCECAVWLGPALSATCTRALSVCCASNISIHNYAKN